MTDERERAAQWLERVTVVVYAEISTYTGAARVLRALVDRDAEDEASLFGKMVGQFVDHAGEAYIEGYVDGAEEAWESADLPDDAPLLSAEQEEERMEKARALSVRSADHMEAMLTGLYEREVGKALGVLMSFRRLCREEGFDANQIMQTWIAPTGLETIGALVGQTDQDTAAVWYERLRAAWDDREVTPT